MPDRQSEVRIQTIHKGRVPLAAAKNEWLTWPNWILFCWATDRRRIADPADEKAGWAKIAADKAAAEKGRRK